MYWCNFVMKKMQIFFVAKYYQEILHLKQIVLLGGVAEGDSAYFETCYCSIYRLSHSCTLLKPLDGMRCNFAETFMWSQVTLC